MFIIGTAGHIDHGKSSIIIRLTGIDPDRLPEEKTRGMTIDLGFAWYDTDDGRRIGIVDVPGHERFVRNMIAGAGGIDAVLLVVAADDGWMPQSQEHMQITRLLGIKYGIVAISKIDLVETGWIDLIEEDIKDRLKGTLLEGAPIVRLSSETGEGFDRLKEEIGRLADKVTEKDDIEKPRLYVDRSFVMSGMGGVVTGTLRGGNLSTGMNVSVFPSRRKGRVRTIQSHSRQVDETAPGQRTAISLTGIDKTFLKRGAVISLPEIVDGFPENPVLALSVELLAESTVSIKDRRRLLMILGTTDVEGEARVYDKDSIGPGYSGIIFFKPHEPVLAFVGDRYIVRLPTPGVTVGGGTVVDILPRFPRRKEWPQYRYLHERVNLTPEILVGTLLKKNGSFDSRSDFLFCNYSHRELDDVIKAMAAKSAIVEHGGRYYPTGEIDEVSANLKSAMSEYFDRYPHIDGLPIESIVRLTGLRENTIVPILELLCNSAELVRKGNRFDLAGRKISIRGDLGKIAGTIEDKFREGRFAPPGVNDVVGDDRAAKEAFDYLIYSGRVVKAGGGIVFHREIWEEMLKIIRAMLDGGEKLTVASFREKIGSTRKFALPVLEETDRLKVTERQGDVRIKGDNFEKS